MMTNEEGLCSESKFVAFCGGPVLNRLCPVSKFILDSEANLSVYSCLVEHLESRVKSDPGLAAWLGKKGTPAGLNIKSFLNYRDDRKYREEKLRGLARQILAVPLKNDEVVPYYEVTNTLKGADRDIETDVRVEDFPYPYRHEDPFPSTSPKGQAQVDEAFRRLLGGMCEFLK